MDWHRFTEIIHSHSRFVLTAHQRPDADCLGSELAMRQILLALGKEVLIVNPQQTPPTLVFLDEENVLNDLEHLTEERKQWLNNADILLVLDTSSWQQLGVMGDVLKTFNGKKIVLDHHYKGDDIGAEKFVAADAEATGTLVVQAAKKLGVALTKDIADAAFAAIATDTGWFRFKSVNAGTYRTAADLTDAGVVPAETYRELYEQESLGRIRLIGRTLSKIEPHFDGKAMITSVFRSDLKETGALPSDTEDIVNMLLSVKNVKMAALFSELKDGSFKISLRSRCEVDCSALAAKFGGGGHQQAAGATLIFPFDEARQKILAAMEEALKTVGE
ncbi:MAG: DHH family phosphoesterase [Planctomycetaceae bacterium]|jgi:phosphoesterase RecJ-like protein|nr:DHH family phosphoesterase [Planctomycetaceae bacterium]